MMKRVILGAVGLVVVLLGPLLTATPAHAGVFNDLVHASDDSGYTAPIRIRCGDGRIRELYRGEWSGPKCGAHVETILPYPNQMVVCHNMLPPYQNRTWWHGSPWDLPSWSSFKCYMQRPI